MFENTAGPVDSGAPIEGTPTEGISNEEMWELEDGKDETGAKRTRKVPVSEARKLAQKGYGADKTFQEASAARAEAQAMKQQVAQLTQLFKQNPWKVMEALGLDSNELIRAKFERELEDAQMDPRDKKLREYETELQQHRRLKAEAEAKQTEDAIISKAQHYQELLFGKIDQALKATGVPNNATTVGEIGRYLQQLHGKTDKQGNPINIFEIPLDDIVRHVHSRFSSGYNEVLQGYDDDSLLNNIDPKVLKRLMAAQTKKLEASGTLQRRNAPVNNIDKFQAKPDDGRKSQKELEADHKARIQQLEEVWRKKNPSKY
jgi:hypothetical protein